MRPRKYSFLRTLLVLNSVFFSFHALGGSHLGLSEYLGSVEKQNSSLKASAYRASGALLRRD